MNTEKRRALSWWSVAYLAFLSLLYIWYTYLTSVNVPFLSWFNEFPLANDMLSGHLTLSDLVTRYGEHGLFGYNVFFLLNVAIFKLNTLVDAYFNVILVVGTGVLAYAAYIRDLKQEDALQRFLLFIPIGLVLFSASQQSSGGMGTQVRMGAAFFFGTSILIDRYLKSSKTSWKFSVITSVSIFLSFVIFGTFYSYAWLPVLFIVGSVNLVKKQNVIKTLVVLGVAAFSAAFYLYFYHVLGLLRSESPPGGMFARIIHLLSDPARSASGLLGLLGSASMGRTLWEDHYISSGIPLILNGLFVFLLYVWATVLTWKDRKSTNLVPLMMIGYTFFVALLVMMGRHSGWRWTTNYWYAVHAKFGLAGALWIISKWFLGRQSELTNDWYGPKEANIKVVATKVAVFGVAGIVFVCLLWSNWAEFKRAPYVKAWYEHMIPALMDPADAPVNSDGNTPLEISRNASIQGVNILRQFHLSLYADRKNDEQLLGTNFYSAKLLTGFYSWEGSSIWIGSRARFEILTGNTGQFTFTGYVPPYQLPMDLTVTSNNGFRKTYKITTTSFRFEGKMKPLREAFVEIIPSKVFVPKKLGKGKDLRTLGVFLHSFWFK